LDSGYSGLGASGISGLLAITLSNDKRNMLLWFRNELVHSLNWAGNPNKLVECDQEGRSFLHPRKSFEAWKEIVHGHCEPWKSPEILAALDIRSSLISIILKKADELAVLNEELENRNIELDSFAHIASHDLKEPLRGIHNYSQILLEEKASKLDEASISRLETLVSLTQRMERIINSLLKYSQQDREEIEPLKVNFLTVLKQVIERLKITIDQEEIVINTASDIPWALCDQSGLAEVLSNLVVNAIKYNTKHPKIIEIGFKPSLEENLNLYYVKDNGIGIPNDQLNVVFKMFKRLHPRNDFGGGTGAGLAIAKKIIERNGGRLWVESTPGEGSTFFFTLKAIRGN